MKHKVQTFPEECCELCMETKESALEKINKLKDGEHCYFNMFQDGGAVCYKCNGMYLLFEITLYGGAECYENIFFENQLTDMVDLAFSWT